VNPATTAVAVAVMLSVTGCSNGSRGQGDMKINGDCGLKSALPVTSLIPVSQLKRILGPGSYTAHRGLIVEDGKVPPEFWGECVITADGESPASRLQVTLIPRSDPAYASYQSTLRAGNVTERLGADGYVVADDGSDAHGKEATGARAAIVEPSRVVVLRVLVPADGRRAAKDAGVAVRVLADNLHHLG